VARDARAPPIEQADWSVLTGAVGVCEQLELNPPRARLGSIGYGYLW
jgi:hypothetical protein